MSDQPMIHYCLQKQEMADKWMLGSTKSREYAYTTDFSQRRSLKHLAIDAWWKNSTKFDTAQKIPGAAIDWHSR